MDDNACRFLILSNWWYIFFNLIRLKIIINLIKWIKKAYESYFGISQDASVNNCYFIGNHNSRRQTLFCSWKKIIPRKQFQKIDNSQSLKCEYLFTWYNIISYQWYPLVQVTLMSLVVSSQILKILMHSERKSLLSFWFLVVLYNIHS